MSALKLRITRACLLAGQRQEVGTIVAVPPLVAGELVGNGKAEGVS